MRHRAAVFIEDAAADDDAFAERFTAVLASEIKRFYVHARRAERGAGDFRERVR
jgi:hypothetical protein